MRLGSCRITNRNGGGWWREQVASRTMGAEEGCVMMGKIAWKVINAGAVVLATAAADEALEVGWRVATGKRPPAVPENPDSRWRKPIVWAMLSGAIAGL